MSIKLSSSCPENAGLPQNKMKKKFYNTSYKSADKKYSGVKKHNYSWSYGTRATDNIFIFNKLWNNGLWI